MDVREEKVLKFSGVEVGDVVKVEFSHIGEHYFLVHENRDDNFSLVCLDGRGYFSSYEKNTIDELIQEIRGLITIGDIVDIKVYSQKDYEIGFFRKN
jgi:hypothetical protein